MPEATPPTAEPAATSAPRGHRKERLGKVISAKMAKTIVVEVQRRFPHPKYQKVITAYSKFYAHDEKSEAKVGDLVLIHETRPLSKLKRWRLTQVVERSPEAAAAAA
jgi:small subunit ribosomal protein S17